jgi:thiol-disulfide isomerase/thioredoxin
MRRMIAAGPLSKRPPQIGLVGSAPGRIALGTAWFATALFVLLLGLPVAVAAGNETIKPGEFIPATPQQPAPQVGFTDADGKPMTLADFEGKPVLVNFWATWCQPCLKEMPSLDRLQAALDGRLAVAAVSEDRGGAKRVGQFVDAMALTKLKIYLDPKGDLGHAFNVRGLPTSIVIDAKGRVVGQVEGGAEWDSVKMMDVLKPLLQNGAETKSP